MLHTHPRSHSHIPDFFPIIIFYGVLELNTKDVEEIMTAMKVPSVCIPALNTSSPALFTSDRRELHPSRIAILDNKVEYTSRLSRYLRFPAHEPNEPDACIGLLSHKKVFLFCYDIRAHSLLGGHYLLCFDRRPCGSSNTTRMKRSPWLASRSRSKCGIFVAC
jgi:hypothetical protein